GLWLAREIIAEAVVAQTGVAAEIFRPRRLLTIEVVRVASSLLVLLLTLAVLVRRAPAAWLLATGGLLAGWTALETVVAAAFRLTGPRVTQQTKPFSDLDYMQVPPGAMRIPTDAERAAVRERLEVDRYRSILWQDRSQFLALVEPHLSAFWDLRLV